MSNKNKAPITPSENVLEHLTVVVFPYILNSNNISKFKQIIKKLAIPKSTICSDKYVKYLNNNFIDGFVDENHKSKKQGAFLSYYKLNANVFNAIYNSNDDFLKLTDNNNETNPIEYKIELKDNCYVLINEFSNSKSNTAENHVYVVLSFNIKPLPTELNKVSKDSNESANEYLFENYINNFKPKFFRELNKDSPKNKDYKIQKFKTKDKFSLNHDDSQCIVLSNKNTVLKIEDLNESTKEYKKDNQDFIIDIKPENEKSKKLFHITLNKLKKSKSVTIGKWKYNAETKTNEEIANDEYKLDDLIEKLLNYIEDNENNFKINLKYRCYDDLNDSESAHNEICLKSEYEKPVLLHLFNYEKDNITDALLSKFKEPLFGTLRLKQNYEIENTSDNDYFYKTNTGSCMVTLHEGSAVIEYNMNLNELFKKYFPAFIITLNQREVMLRINNINGKINPNAILNNQNYKEIEDISTYINLFNFKQVFYVVSHTHELQLFYSKLQKAFSIEILLNDIKESVSDVRFLLDRKDQKREEANQNTLNFILLFLTIAQILPVVFEYLTDFRIPEKLIPVLHIVYVICFFYILIKYFIKHIKKS